jgi:hypothetical protein
MTTAFEKAYDLAREEAGKKIAVWAYENPDDGEYVLHYATLDLLEKKGWKIGEEDA